MSPSAPDRSTNRGWWRASSGKAGPWSSRPHLTSRCMAAADAGRLVRHNRLGFGFVRHIDGWPFLDKTGNAMMVPITGNALVSDGEAMRLMALSGAGIARLARWHVSPDIATGRLVLLLEGFNPGDEEFTHAVYVGQGKHLPARVRALLDFLVEAVRLV